MFASWTDAIIAVLIVLGTNRLVAMVSYWRGNAQILLRIFRGAEPQEPPGGAEDLWSTSIGQRRSDARRQRRAVTVVILGIALSQLVAVSPIPTAACLFAAWVLVHIAHIAYGRVMFAMGRLMDSEERERQMVIDLVRSIVSTRADPFAGVMRPLGFVGAVASLGLAFAGWMAVLEAVGVPPQGLPSPLGAIGVIGDAGVLLGACGVALIVVARLPMQLARQIALGRPADQRTPEGLYLRSFNDDALSLPISGISRSLVDRVTLRYQGRYEQLLVGAAQELGPVAAIGRPGERLPPLGAFRRYYPDDQWQREVAKLIGSVDLIVVSVGETSSFAWEVEEIRDQGLLSHAIFVVPPVDADARSQRLRMLADLLRVDRDLLDCEAVGVEILAVSFSDTGKPTLLTSRFRDYAGYAGAVIGAAFDRSAEAEAARGKWPADDPRTAEAARAQSQPRDVRGEMLARKRVRLDWLEQRERELLGAGHDDASLRPVREQLAAARSEIAALDSTLDGVGPAG